MDTVTLPPCNYSTWEVEAFRPLIGMLRHAIDGQDPRLLGRVTTASAEISQRHRPKPLMPELSKIAKATGAVGIQVAHSGTVAGFLFEPDKNVEDRLQHARAKLRGIGLHKSRLFSTDFSQKLEPVL